MTLSRGKYKFRQTKVTYVGETLTFIKFTLY